MVFLFFCKLTRWGEQFSWQVKKNTFFKNKIKPVHSLEIYTINASFNAKKVLFSKMWHEMLFLDVRAVPTNNFMILVTNANYRAYLCECLGLRVFKIVRVCKAEVNFDSKRIWPPFQNAKVMLFYLNYLAFQTSFCSPPPYSLPPLLRSFIRIVIFTQIDGFYMMTNAKSNYSKYV